MRSFIKGRRPSATMIIASLALVFALGGTAVAVVGLNGKQKKQVKKISKKQANKQINAKAGGLSVSHASTADTASQAAGPSAFFRVDNPQSGTPGVIEADSRGVSDGNFSDSPVTGVFCLHGVSVRSASATGDIGNPNNDDNNITVQFTLGDPFADCTPGATGVFYVFDADDGSASDSGFYAQLYN